MISYRSLGITSILLIIITALSSCSPQPNGITPGQKTGSPPAISQTVQPTGLLSSSDFQPENRTVKERFLLNQNPASPVLVISPDGQRVACIGQVENMKFRSVVLDSIEGKVYDNIQVHSLVFSPDSRHFAYIAVQNRQRMLVIDGVEGQPYDAIEDFVFSPDSQHYAYAVKMSTSGREGFIVRDGTEGKHYDEAHSPVFSPDSQRLAYVVTDYVWTRLVLDESPGMTYYEIVDILFSPDSQKLACITVRETTNKEFYDRIVRVIVINGREIVEYPNIDCLIVSPDSQRFACYARTRTEKYLVVIEGNDVTSTETTLSLAEASTLNFTPDNRLSFFSHKLYDVEGQRENFEYLAEIHYQLRPIWSPDGKRLAYVTSQSDNISKGMSVVLDGIKGEKYPSIYSMNFSPDSSHLAYTVNDSERNGSFVVVDGVEGRVYDSVSKLVFDSSDHLRYNAQKGDSIYLVDETMK